MQNSNGKLMRADMINVSQPPRQNSIKNRIWLGLVEPTKALHDEETRQQARLLSALIFLLFLFLSIGLVVTLIWYAGDGMERAYTFAVTCLLVFVSYGLSRTRFYFTAGALALLILSLFPFAEILAYHQYEDISLALMWLIVPIILATVLLRIREQVLLALVDILGLVVLASANLQSVYLLSTIGAFVLTITGTLSVLEIYRRQRENIRQKELVRSNQELESIRTSLEDQVAERTQNAEEAKVEAEKATRALEMQMWQVTGMAELATVMRGVQTTAGLASGIIRQVCRYAEIPVGALFIAERDELRLAGSYGYPFILQPAPRFKFGSGLVGEAARNQQVVTLRDIPEHYLPITSGLGEVAPAQIIAVPCTFQDQVVGVMELASLQPFTAAQIQFFTSAVESIASALDTAKIRTQIDELLVETQQLAEELQTQDEEQRRGNIELDQRKAALLYKEQQLQDQQSMLEVKTAEKKDSRAASRDTEEIPDDD